MNLIDRYISHVGKHLPEKSREDLKREIRSLVEDTLEDRSKELGRPVDEALTVDVLKEFGRPEKMAASYVPERYLISPRMFPIFWLVVRIVASVLLAIMLVKLFIGFGQADANYAQLLIQMVIDFAAGAISAFGNIVLVFAAIQYFIPELGQQLDKEDEWNPLKMEKIESDDELSRFEQVFGITFSVIGLALFNFFPELLGFGFVNNGEWMMLPAFSKAFFSYLPWINLIWGAEIILSLFLLIQGRWQAGTRWVSLGIKFMSIALAGFMLAGPSLISLNPEELARAEIGFTLENATRLISLLEQGIKGTLILVIVLGGFEIAKRIYKLLSAKAVK
ncbi:MAG: hypothetical protein CVU44_20015 [Chloroflexi bacterium HGW-Chloroflexi-6]|nr:MAG: hypothetical protein CVU44_20015 [Chloroflexi bacterium HGW-Chloroflexi-6]